MGARGPVVISSAAVELEPLGDWVLLRKLDETTTKGGLYIPDVAQQSLPAHAEVVAVGPGRHESGALIECPVQVGDLVLLNPGAEAIQVSINGEQMALARGSMMLGVCRVNG